MSDSSNMSLLGRLICIGVCLIASALVYKVTKGLLGRSDAASWVSLLFGFMGFCGAAILLGFKSGPVSINTGGKRPQEDHQTHPNHTQGGPESGFH